ncbi:hypothetical protein DRF65_03430 [Chryseobacterium pennae]|uniref:Uncharacterized protein n=1 Tax=Chryseobacterium pennae TaxID=2258962 RepID=A0A3D9CCZ5_9FLAO|nr:hypothetical protein [Chryseobacterium pennae]REC63773.1 hypothetical protein DRF65_03430 [Chryseobacterium pennae]
MKTDSENNMMNKFFSLHFIGGGRFLFLLMLLVNFQMTQSICRQDDSTSPDAATPSTTLFISEGTAISGMEQVHISQPKKEKTKKISKRKNTFISSKRKQEKEKNISPPVKSSNKTVLIFSRDPQSEGSLLIASENKKQIIRPQHMMKFLLLKPESKTPVLHHLLDIYLNKPYKSRRFSYLSLSRNFNRPPPQAHSTGVMLI